MQTGMDFLPKVHCRKPSGKTRQCNGRFGPDFPVRKNAYAHMYTHIQSQASPTPDHELLVRLNSGRRAVSFSLYQHNASLHQDIALSDLPGQKRKKLKIYSNL